MENNIFHQNRNNCVHLICQETVAFVLRIQCQEKLPDKHANAYDKLSGSDRAEKVKQLKAVLASQQRFFSQARKSNTTKASHKAAMLIAKHGKPFIFYG